MRIVDAQLHDPSVSRDWDGADERTRRGVLTELQLAYMAAAGVDAAVLFPVDLGWAEEAAAEWPERFAIVRMVTPEGRLGGIDPAAPDVEDIVEAEWAKPALVGLRILPRMFPDHDGSGYVQLRDGFYDRALATCERLGIPVFVSAMGNLSAPAEVAGRFPRLTVVVDHFGLRQPPELERDSPPFGALDELLALAALPNVAVKFCGAPVLSLQPFPYLDVWVPLRRVVDAFGADRLMWASDISRFDGRVGFDIRLGWAGREYDGKHSYAESLLAVRETPELSPAEKEWLLGGTVRKLIGWPA